MQGVGSTLDFQGRVSDYITHMYKEKDTCEIVEHFRKLEDHSLWDFSIMRIVQIENPPRNRKKLKQRLREFEGYWQVNLNTKTFWDEFYKWVKQNCSEKRYWSSL